MPRLRIIGALVALLLALSACAGGEPPRVYDYRINNLPASASDLTTVIDYHDDVDPDRGEISTPRFLEKWQEVASPHLVSYADLPAPIQALPIGQRAILDLQDRTSNHQPVNVLPGRYLTYDGDTAATPTEHLDGFLYLEEQPDGTIEAALVRTRTTDRSPSYRRDSFVSRLDGVIVDFMAPGLPPDYREGPDENILDTHPYRQWSARAIAASCSPAEISTGCLYVPAEYGPVAGLYIATSEAALVDRLMPQRGAGQRPAYHTRRSDYALAGELPGTAVEFNSYYAAPPRPGIAALPAGDQITILRHEGGRGLGGNALAGLPTYGPPAR